MLSVIIIAKNEEANIGKCLGSVDFADEVIVLDSGSQDRTVEIAKTYTDKVYETDWQGYGIQKQRALSKAQGDWVLNLDADEYVDDALKHAIISAMAENQADAYRIPIRMHFYGKALRYSSSPKRHIRLFKRDGAAYSTDIVHEKVVLPRSARVAQMRQAILHHSFQDVSHALYKINKYSSYSAKIRVESGKKASFIKSLTSALWMFQRCYFLQLGILDGKAGFLFAVFNAQGAFYRGIKQMYKDSDWLERLPDVQTEKGNHH
jgi:glycosyltransferase involved in cell wall biosynthesis